MLASSSSNGSQKVGVYICHCGINISSKVDIDEVVKFASKLPEVTIAREYKFMCSDPGQALIEKDIHELGINRVVVASCSPLMHEPTFRQTLQKSGENPFHFQMANIREHVSWVTAEQSDATNKTKSLIAAAVYRVVLHTPLVQKKVAVHPDVMVVGGGITGIHAALTIANSGKKVYLVEREPSIGGHMAKFDKTFPTLDCSACILTPKMTQVNNHPNIVLLTYSEVDDVSGYVGNFKVKIRKKARFVDEKLCTGCDECTKVCPAEIVSEFDEGLTTRKAIYRPFPQSVPNVFTISRKGTPPCQSMCSIHQNVQGYVTLIGQKKYEEALDVILRDNPLPSICGRICTHPCNVACTRSKIDDPINISTLKRFVTDWAQINNFDYKLPKSEVERQEKVAIVGSGPAGLICAYELRKKGYQIEIFESQPVAGGMLAVGIPDFRLPKDILNIEIEKLEELGIRINLNTLVGENGLSLESLKHKYDAVFLGIGAHKEKKLRIPGEDLENIWGGIEFLRRVNLDKNVSLGKSVIVIGGGNSALDAARTALRVGAEEVQIVYRRSKAEMPAEPGEIRAAEEEGIKFNFLASPKKFNGNRTIESVVFQKMKLGTPDESWRPRPVPIPNSEYTVHCDDVIVTIGQSSELDDLNKDNKINTSNWGTIHANPVTLETNIKGVFAGGDCVNGPEIVVTAMAAGKKAANSIDRYINNQDMFKDRENEGTFESTIEFDTEGYLVKKRIEEPSIELNKRHTFEEVNIGYTEEMAINEASRCLSCAECCDCQLCQEVCEPKCIDYSMQDKIEEVDVGAIILATGFKTVDAKRIPRYGYKRFPGVYTSLEVERMVNASGPTGGKIILKDGKTPETIGIIHCVGSRDNNIHQYCSRVCCMYSLKLAHLMKERTGAEVYNFYIDMRTPGKGYEEFYEKLLNEDVHLIRGRVAEVSDWAVTPEENNKLVIRVEDTLIGVVRRIPVDMVVLSTGLEPQKDAEEVRRLFNISCSTEGWFLERHPKLAPVSTFTDGIFISGNCQGPKDIPDSIAQSGAAAAEVLALVDKGFVELEPNTAEINEEVCSGCKTCIPLCPFTAITFNLESGKSEINEALCKGCGTCVAACPSGAANQRLFTDEQIYQEIQGLISYV